MRALIDTHVFLWHLAGDRRLSHVARAALEDPENEWFLSAASVWEMSIKAQLGRLKLPMSVHEYIQEKIAGGLRVLAIEWTEAAAVEPLPMHHRDPFDRLLIAQALSERLALVTSDALFERYGVTVIW